jgi:hypothetical protein
MVKDGTLTRLDTAFSRDQTQKIYVQDRMRENAAELYAWLECGAYFYVCGDATQHGEVGGAGAAGRDCGGGEWHAGAGGGVSGGDEEAEVSAVSAGHLLVSDAEVVGPPAGGDGLLDLFLGEVVVEGALDQGGQFRVGGEAQADELGRGEGLAAGEVFGGEERGEAQALFEADDAVLHCDGVQAGAADGQQQDDGHQDPPKEEVAMVRPVMDGVGDGEDNVEQQDGRDEEVPGGIEAGVVLVVLRFGRIGVHL